MVSLLNETPLTEVIITQALTLVQKVGKKNLQLNSSYSENLWLRGEISSTKNLIITHFLKPPWPSLIQSFMKEYDIRVETFFEISLIHYSGPEISPSWYRSHWFGSFQSNRMDLS